MGICCLPAQRVIGLFCWLLAGYIWAFSQAHSLIQQRLPASLAHQDLQITGVIASLPESLGQRARFDFLVIHARPGITKYFPRKLRLSWYNKPEQMLEPGQVWTLITRLHTPHGFMDMGVFDYSAWLLRQGIVATGYVVNKGENGFIGNDKLRVPIQVLRFRLQRVLKQLLGNEPASGLVRALLIGDRSGIAQQQWQVLRQTGTVHLMAISGLHIGYIAALVFF